MPTCTTLSSFLPVCVKMADTNMLTTIKGFHGKQVALILFSLGPRKRGLKASNKDF